MTVAAVAAIIAPAIDEVIAAHAALGAKRLLVQALTNRVVELRRQCAALGWRLARDGRQSGGGGSVCRRRRRRGARSFDRGLISANVHFSITAEGACRGRRIEPGSFAAALVDALDAVDETSLRSRAKIQPAVLIQ
jgi:hypothetical protein